ncbi:GntR family transcriptional regulator [Leifsonia sp. ZF2019]|uniref:GntR family transcriptional regulator n=1 Tax=Leifsonia sp. ZF2019 TaxID=2781978 RepID=UPI001CC0874D|nr:GntR family transcriptional regulator [Leifsonia sp. ZF2019]
MPAPRKLDRVTIERALLKDVVRDRLRDAIMDGTFEAGEILRDADLVEWFGVSRTPVRDAINDLTRIGLIDTAPNRYTRVAQRRKSDIAPALRALSILHGGSALLTVPSVDDDDRATLHHASTDLASALSASDSEATARAFIQLFDSLLRFTPNQIFRDRVADAVDGLYFRVPLNQAVQSLAAARRNALSDANDAFAAALADHDGQRARDAVEAMHAALLPER